VPRKACRNTHVERKGGVLATAYRGQMRCQCPRRAMALWTDKEAHLSAHEALGHSLRARALPIKDESKNCKQSVLNSCDESHCRQFHMCMHNIESYFVLLGVHFACGWCKSTDDMVNIHNVSKHPPHGYGVASKCLGSFPCVLVIEWCKDFVQCCVAAKLNRECF
jgi:hypothetical protein